ncbi:YpzG family protein [Bacillus sp. MRMR6]|uniref:YpzG family protein n=1 Tax=Bacillus sp. MRMR6 TaxID=1928617 RepID=UPI0009510CE7|nr:YpzG family protein [Bacillus sp. MRMR6]OLS38554.1 YpzG family protein [Bacillus sp. MRMR6]
MSYRDQLDDQSKLFHKNHTRRKHLNSQVNGETQVTQNTIRARGNAKAHRMF